MAKIWKPTFNGRFLQVGLGEAEVQVAREVADVGLHAQGFAQSEEVVGLVVQADEGAGEAADAAIQADGVLALLLHLEQQLDGGVLRVLVGLRVLFDLQRVKVVKLVQAQQAGLPEVAVVDLAFFQQQLAADDADRG